MSHQGTNSGGAHRPILPRVEPAASTNEIEKMEGVPQRKHVGLACMECKRRKTKCDGTNPCSMCTRKATECVYEAAQSRLESLRMQNDEYKRRNEQYKTILAFLRTGTVDESQEILSRLRTGPSIEAVVEHIDNASLLTSPSTERSTERSESRGVQGKVKRKYDEASEEDTAGDGTSSFSTPRHKPISDFFDGGLALAGGMYGRRFVSGRLPVAALLSDPSPPANFKHASDWTNVTDNDVLVKDLIAMWFSHYQPFLQICEPQSFYQALSAGPAYGSDACSPLLVNCIAAAACHISEHITGKTTPWDPSFIGKTFLDEALSLYRAEEGKDSLTNLQAMVILCDIMSHNGEDKKGTSFLQAACQHARSSGLLRDPKAWDGRPKDAYAGAIWEKARAHAVWALFNYQASTCYSLQRCALIRRAPVVEIPVDEKDEDINMILFRAQCQLSLIMNELCLHHFADDDGFAGYQTSVENTETLFQRLLSFQDSLHPAITAEPDGHPTTLLLQMQIRYITVSLFAPYAETDRLSIGQRFYKTRAAAESRVALIALRQLLNLWSYCFGFGKCPYYLSHILLFDGLTAIDELKEAQSRNILAPTDAYTGLMGSIIALGEMSQRFVVCEANLKALEVKSDNIGVKLSVRAQQALRVVMQPGWLEKVMQHFRSSIPMSLASSLPSFRPENFRLDHMLKAWSLDEAPGREEGGEWPGGRTEGEGGEWRRVVLEN